MFHLIDRARPRRLVGPPTQEFRAVAETPAGEMVVLNFNHELRVERFPFAAAFGAPATRPARRSAGETAALLGWLLQLLDLRGQLFTLVRGQGGAEANVMEQA